MTTGTYGQPAYLPADVEPGEVREADVEQHQVGPAVADRGERFPAGAECLDVEALALQQRHQVRAQRRLVLDDDDPHSAPLPPPRVSTRSATNHGGFQGDHGAPLAAGRAPSGQADPACPLFLTGGAAEAPRSRAAEGGRAATREARP
jgi:hypothetical protein